MNDQNRYEEVPQKENKFKKGLKALGSYLKFVFVDFFNSFKYNNMKLAAILFAMPGILLGFFMFAHVPTMRHVKASYERDLEGSSARITAVADSSTSEEGDYQLTIEKYTVNDKEYSDIVLKRTSPVVIEGDNEDLYPVDGSPKEDANTAAATPIVTAFDQKQDTSGETPKYIDSYSIKIDYEGLTDAEKVDIIHNLSSYSVFLYQEFDDVMYYTGFSYSVPAKEFSDDPESSSFMTATISDVAGLSDKNTYKVCVKAVPMSGKGLYSSAVSSLKDFEVKLETANYSIGATQFAKYAGSYKVDNASNEDLEKLSVNILPDGSISYIDGVKGKTVPAQLSENGSELASRIREKVSILPFDFSGICIFFLTLFGFLNVFLSLELSKKKNFGTVIKCTLTTVAILGLGILYIYSIFATEAAIKLPEGRGLSLPGITTIIDSNAIVSIATVIGACVFSVAGLILAFINYDRTYEKVDR